MIRSLGLRVHLAWRRDDDRDGEVHVVRVDEADGDACVAGEGAVHRVVGQDLAVNPIAGDAGHRADDVGRVDVLHIDVLEKRANTYLYKCETSCIA